MTMTESFFDFVIITIAVYYCVGVCLHFLPFSEARSVTLERRQDSPTYFLDIENVSNCHKFTCQRVKALLKNRNINFQSNWKERVKLWTK